MYIGGEDLFVVCVIKVKNALLLEHPSITIEEGDRAGVI